MLIGLNGKMRSGKDTAYAFINEWAQVCNRPCKRDAFADRLKVSAARALGFGGNWEECIDEMNELKTEGTITVSDPTGKYVISCREYLQWYGTEAHREIFGDGFWVDACLPDQYSYDGPEIEVITDVRFPNEAERIRALGGEIWQILRPRNVDVATDAHASEQPLPIELVDHVILNDGSLDHFKDLVLSRVERMTYA